MNYFFYQYKISIIPPEQKTRYSVVFIRIDILGGLYICFVGFRVIFLFNCILHCRYWKQI